MDKKYRLLGPAWTCLDLLGSLMKALHLANWVETVSSRSMADSIALPRMLP